jgi:hypothetical protein
MSWELGQGEDGIVPGLELLKGHVLLPVGVYEKMAEVYFAARRDDLVPRSQVGRGVVDDEGGGSEERLEAFEMYGELGPEWEVHEPGDSS